MHRIERIIITHMLLLQILVTRIDRRAYHILTQHSLSKYHSCQTHIHYHFGRYSFRSMWLFEYNLHNVPYTQLASNRLWIDLSLLSELFIRCYPRPLNSGACHCIQSISMSRCLHSNFVFVLIWLLFFLANAVQFVVWLPLLLVSLLSDYFPFYVFKWQKLI